MNNRNTNNKYTFVSWSVDHYIYVAWETGVGARGKYKWINRPSKARVGHLLGSNRMRVTYHGNWTTADKTTAQVSRGRKNRSNLNVFRERRFIAVYSELRDKLWIYDIRTSVEYTIDSTKR